MMNDENNIESGSVANSPASDDAVLNRGEDLGEDLKGDAEGDEEVETYPGDCYSFMSLHGPFDKGGFFYFGFFVWVFQVVFLMLFVLRVAHKRLSTNEETDNPNDDSFFSFVPANSAPLSKATQFMALLSYCAFADDSLKDIVTAVETFPRFSRAEPGDKPYCIAFSCLLRFTQGFLATIVVVLLVISTDDVIDIILNFTAVNFISGFDDVAFELAQWGKYGPKLETEANRIEELPAPACIIHKYKHTRFGKTVMIMALLLLGSLSVLTHVQYSKNEGHWITRRLRVQFKDDPLHEKYNGCYDMTESSNSRWKKYVTYESYEENEEKASFGYCVEDKKWHLYMGYGDDACNITEEEKVAVSSKNYAFDISAIFDEGWQSRAGTPLEWYFFDDNKVTLDDEECDSFLGDGICNRVFNKYDYYFDEGDCCAASCSGLNCGVGNLAEELVFNKIVTFGDGFPHCRDDSMKNITIQINNIYVPPISPYAFPETGPFAGLPALDPLLMLDCDGQNILNVNIEESMKLETQTVQVADGADCELSIKNQTAAGKINFVNYTVYHGDKESIETDPIVIFNEDTSENGIRSFQRIEECYFDKLKYYTDIAAMYTGNDPSNKAIHWLSAEGSSGSSNCRDALFVERYALATINYAAPKSPIMDTNETEGIPTDGMDLWINSDRQCSWPNVVCKDGRVIELELLGLSLLGTIPTEIGLLVNLEKVDLSFNQIYGSIPTEIGEWQSLEDFRAASNNMTGTIPTEIGFMSNLKWFIGYQNQISGTIPSEIGVMSSLKGFAVAQNQITGSIPSEIGFTSSLEYFLTGENFLTGTIPSVFGSLNNLTQFESNGNSLSGTIPSELSQLTLETFRLDFNTLTGSIPIELRTNTSDFFLIYGNSLSDLIPIDGFEICYTEEMGEAYCNCASDCVDKQYQCACEEAQWCCDSFVEQLIPCVICPLENPDFYVEDFLATCQEASDYILSSLLSYGTEEACSEQAVAPMLAVGCRCAAQNVPPEDPVIENSGDEGFEIEDSATADPVVENSNTKVPVVEESVRI